VINAEVVIIGAGPTGLFQVFELGLLGLKAHVIESLDKPGGQCSELYPDKPIYDIPACPAIGAQELTDRLLEQIEPFGATFHFGQEVNFLEKQADNKFVVKTSTGQVFLADAVVIAAGMGSFTPIRLRVADIDQFEGNQLAYNVKDPQQYRNKDVVVLGGGDSALDWVLALQPIVNSVTLVHRNLKFKAAPASVAKMEALCEAHEMQFLLGNVSDFESDAGELKKIKVTGGDGVTRVLALDSLLVFFGLSPKLGAIADWGLELHKSQIKVDTEKFQTSIDGLYAVGDINYYPGKKKLILSGFHEAALAAFAIKEQLNPDKKVHLQYTTTSPIMHQRLQVDDPFAA
jgi:thioredoxin reductase (NADPH)